MPIETLFFYICSILNSIESAIAVSLPQFTNECTALASMTFIHGDPVHRLVLYKQSLNARSEIGAGIKDIGLELRDRNDSNGTCISSKKTDSLR